MQSEQPARVSEVMGQGERLRQVLIQAQCPRDGPGDLRNFNRMREARPVVVTLVVHEHLRLVLQPPEGRRMDDAVTVAGKVRTRRGRRFRHQAATAPGGVAGIGLQVAHGHHIPAVLDKCPAKPSKPIQVAH